MRLSIYLNKKPRFAPFGKIIRVWHDRTNMQFPSNIRNASMIDDKLTEAESPPFFKEKTP